MTGMIERVALAMAAKDSGPEGSKLFGIHWDGFRDGYMSSALAAIEAISQWHDEQAAGFRKMANDDRLSDDAIAKAWGASKHHAGTAASMRSILIGNKESSNE